MLNFYELNDVKKLNTPSYNPHFKQTQMNIPFRCGLIGASGSGKTNALMNYIRLTSGTFGEIHICYKTTEPLYELLDKKLKSKNIYFYTDVSKMPEPKDLKEKEKQKLIIFDDMLADKDQTKIINYFIYGRKQNCSTFILSQSYYGVPKTIRGQFSYLILVKVSGQRDLNMILKDTGSLGLEDESLLKKMYNKATSTKMNFLKIDLNTSDLNKKFSINFTDFFKLTDEIANNSDSDD
jgi:hypothetical protein